MSETDPTRPEPTRAQPPPVPTGAAATSPRRLYRDPTGPVGGVASGLAAYFEIDPVIVRLLWIVALLTGIGFPAYLVSWIVIPKAKVWPPAGYALPATRETRSAAIVSGLIIVGLAALIGRGADGMADLLLPAALIGFGVYLLNQRRSDPAPDPVAGVAVEEEPAPVAVAGPPSLVTPTVLSLLAIAAGVCWALAAAGLVHPTVVSLAAGGLVLVGLGLLSSLWFGRAPWLTVLGVGLTGVLVVASAVEPWVQKARAFQSSSLAPLKLNQLKGTVGDRRFNPRSLAELQPRYGLGVGELEVDLSDLDFTGTTREVELQVGMGEVIVIVPDDVNVEVHGQAALGEANAFGIHSEGMGATVDTSDPALNAGTLRVKFSVGLGEGTVRREK
ncbi:MAG: hypothetical protein RL033_3788 [Pseudomonadota bacterium]